MRPPNSVFRAPPEGRAGWAGRGVKFRNFKLGETLALPTPEWRGMELGRDLLFMVEDGDKIPPWHHHAGISPSSS